MGLHQYNEYNGNNNGLYLDYLWNELRFNFISNKEQIYDRGCDSLTIYNYTKGNENRYNSIQNYKQSYDNLT